ncbi:MAG: hypothetical protein HZC38_04810 [Chloroflexi bacterium]|nr:hypothetical protein [Chloroflexota bacterium]MBI5712732.1 hypothetical protein [Chloroflexota bacterium]
MTTKQLTSIVAILLLGACLVILLPIAYLVIRNYWNYQTDLNTLTSIAAKLGHTPDRQLNLYESSAQTYHILRVAFYTSDSLDQFSARVQSLGFRLEYFMSEEVNKRSTTSVLQKANYGLQDKFVTLNGRYKTEDFYGDVPSPLESTWKLYSPTRAIEIHYGRVPSSTDAFIYDGKPLGGNVVVVTLHRPMCWGC